MPKVSCLYVFDQHLSLIFHFSQISGIFLPRNITLQKLFLTSLPRKFCCAKTNQVGNRHLLQTSNVWQQDMSCLHPIRTSFFLTCTCLDATDGTCNTQETYFCLTQAVILSSTSNFFATCTIVLGNNIFYLCHTF